MDITAPAPAVFKAIAMKATTEQTIMKMMIFVVFPMTI